MAGFIKRFVKGFVRAIFINSTDSVNKEVSENEYVDIGDICFRDKNNVITGYVGSNVCVKDGKKCLNTYIQTIGNPSNTTNKSTLSVFSSVDGSIHRVESTAPLKVALDQCTTNITPTANNHISSKKYVDDKASAIQASIKYLPDYSKAVSLSGSTYTARANGFVILVAYGRTTVNGFIISKTEDFYTYCIPVSVGDTIKAYKIFSFIPFK